MSAVVALAAFVLVAAGTIVAVITFMTATGKPDLEAEIIFRFSYPNLPVFALEDGPEPQSEPRIAPWRQVEGKVYLHNRSAYSAKNPGFRIDFVDLGGFDIELNSGWTPIAAANMIGITSIQWDGGADYVVHGQWTRPLPDLNLAGSFLLKIDANPALVVTIAADGFMPKKRRIPVKCLPQDEYQEYTRLRAENFTQG